MYVLLNKTNFLNPLLYGDHVITPVSLRIIIHIFITSQVINIS